jgi:hypothetical protein
VFQVGTGGVVITKNHSPILEKGIQGIMVYPAWMTTAPKQKAGGSYHIHEEIAGPRLDLRLLSHLLSRGCSSQSTPGGTFPIYFVCFQCVKISNWSLRRD